MISQAKMAIIPTEASKTKRCYNTSWDKTVSSISSCRATKVIHKAIPYLRDIWKSGYKEEKEIDGMNAKR